MVPVLDFDCFRKGLKVRGGPPHSTPPCAAESVVVIWRIHCGLLQSVVCCWLLLLVAAGCTAGCLL